MDWTLADAAAQAAPTPAPGGAPAASGGRIKQTVCQWCFGGLTKTAEAKEKFYADIAKMGYKGVDLAKPGDFPLLKKQGLICSMLESHRIEVGFNRTENHEKCGDAVKKGIEAAAANGYPNVICFSGNRAGMADDEGARNTIDGIKKIVGLAEEKKITVCLELLNSKGHKDYMADHTSWGVPVVKAVGSPRFKLLFDIFHMAEMGEDVIAMIKEHHECFGHYHTAGSPGRNEIDDSQKLKYPDIMKAIAETGYQGLVGQEFIPKKDALTSLQQAYKICDV